jgi:muramoyltetrapeptide carboxypeptidase
MLAGNFGAPELDAFTMEHFWRALHPAYSVEWQGNGPHWECEGQLWGGNLAMLVSLIGTPWMPDIEDGILVLEDINEHPFRVERMLLQLYHAGILARQSAIVLGSFSGAAPMTMTRATRWKRWSISSAPGWIFRSSPGWILAMSSKP